MIVRTLVVDDERLARQRILRLLRPEPDIEVVGECSDGQQALALVRSVAPDLMFLDLQMPGLSGFDVLEALRAVPLPVIIVATAYDHLAAEAFELKAIYYANQE
jgi:two-component system LytT family response regulator